MPKITEETAEIERHEGPGGVIELRRVSDAGGLTQFGAYVETLPPGAYSSMPHWHKEEDEFIYILDGEVTLHEGADSHVLRPGDAATFRAGDAVAHCLQNRGEGPCRYLIVGTRKAFDVITYPRHDRVLHLAADGTNVWTDRAGEPASNPYADV